MADACGRFSVFSAAEVPPIRRGSALIRGGLPRNLFSPPSPRRIPRRKFLFHQKKFLSDSASEAIRPTRTHSDSGGLNRSPPRNCSAKYITDFSRGGQSPPVGRLSPPVGGLRPRLLLTDTAADFFWRTVRQLMADPIGSDRIRGGLRQSRRTFFESA